MTSGDWAQATTEISIKPKHNRRHAMKKLLVLLTGLMLVSSLGMAQADPDENSMGMYFDTDGYVTAVTTTAPFQQVFGYLCVVNPTSNGISGW
jgi:hypothetical protein